jgi:hypothetical protein
VSFGRHRAIWSLLLTLLAACDQGADAPAPLDGGATGADLSPGSFDLSPPAAAALEWTPRQFDFGTVATNGIVPHVQELALRNVGGQPSDPLVVSGLTAPFAISRDGCAGKPLQPNESCTVDVTFAATGEGVFAGTLVARAGAAQAQASLHGSADLDVRLTIEAPSTPPTWVGEERLVSVTVHNEGDSPAGLVTVTFAPWMTSTDAIEIVSNECATTPLGPQQSCRVDLRFVPRYSMSYGGTLSARALDRRPQQALIELRGQLHAQLFFDGQSPSGFPLTQAGIAPVTIPQRILNFGDEPVVGPVALTFNGGPFALFAVASTTCGAGIAAHGSCDAELRFYPYSVGEYQSVLRATAAGVVPIERTVTAESRSDTDVVITETAIDLGVTWGQPSKHTATIHNVSLTRVSGLVASATAPFTVVDDHCAGTTLSPTGECTVVVQLATPTNGRISGTLAVGAAGARAATASLSGSFHATTIVRSPW